MRDHESTDVEGAARLERDRADGYAPDTTPTLDDAHDDAFDRLARGMARLAGHEVPDDYQPRYRRRYITGTDEPF